MQNTYLFKNISVCLMFFTTFFALGQVTNTTQNTQYTTISAAITAAQPGDVITVAAGTYNENLTINKSITLKGPNATVAGTGTRASEAIINNSKVTFSGAINSTFCGFKIYQTNNTTETVTISSTSSVTFKNNILERFGVTTGQVCRAVYTNPDATGTIIIEGNKFTGDDSGNLFSGHKTWQSGIWTGGNTNLQILNNYFEHCRAGMNINPMSNGVVISGNTFTDNGNHITFGGAPTAGTYTMGANEFGITRDGIINLSGLTNTFKLNIASCTFGGQLASSLPLAQQMMIEAALYHKGRDSRHGLVTFVNNQLFVVNGVSSGIQQAVDYAVAGNIINVSAGTYNEPITVSKSITLKGANPATTIITAPPTGGSSTVFLNANNIYFSGFTITRECPTLDSWLTATRNNGLIVGQQRSGVVIDNVIIKRNRNGIYWAKSQVTVTNSLIEENRTGFNIDGNISGTIITNNIIRNNLTHGIALNNNTNNIIDVTDVVISNNSITGNYHSNIAFLDDAGWPESGTAMATCNWFGTTDPVTNAVATTEPGYTSQIPGFFGGTIPTAPIDGDLAGAGIANVVATPRLTVGTNMASSGVGFDGNLSSCAAITTQIFASQCGTTIPSFGSGIFANSVTGATAYRFRVNNGFATQVIENNHNYFTLNQLSSYGYAGSYTIEVSCFVNGSWTIYGTSCTVAGPAFPTTKLKDNQCNTTIAGFTTGIFANSVPLVTKYRFRVTNGGNVQLYETDNAWFRLKDLASYAYLTTYTVDVACFSNGVWSDYGPTCTISTPQALPTPVVQSNLCETVQAFNAGIYCTNIPLAEGYRFKVESVNGVEIINTPNRYIKLNMLPAYFYNTAYTISAAVQIGGEWSEYGATCIINTPATPPVTNLRTAYCGATINTRNDAVYCDVVPAVSTYRFRITSTSGTQTIDKAVAYFKFKELVGIFSGETVVVDVMTISTNGISSPYGTTCNVTLSASASRPAGEQPEGKVSAKTYPNPFVEGFIVQMDGESTEPVSVSVFDMNGRMLDTFTAQPDELSTKQFGAGYAAGIYNITVSQGAEHKVLHVVKK